MMSNMQESGPRGFLIEKLRAFHANQSGAIAMAVMASLLITLMMSLVLYDATPAARQKLEVQTAADTAAWSQAAVKARTMNMISFANVGKRIIFGQALFYASLFKAHLALLVIVFVAWLFCLILDLIPFTACGILTQLSGDLANLAYNLANEAQDVATFYNTIVDRSNEDLEAIDNYQVYFKDYTPWWSWGEGWRRGVRNGAFVSGWPVPDLPDFLDDVPDLDGIGFSGQTDAMPIERDSGMRELCIRSYIPDLGFHILDYTYHTIIDCDECTDTVMSQGIITSDMRIALALIGAMAIGIYAISCEAGGGDLLSTSFTEDYVRPWQLTDPGSFGNNEAEWYRRTSNLVFAYQPGRDFTDDFRGKFDYLSPDYETSLDLVYKPDGFFGMARAEFSFQDGDPDMWHPSWTARMRPVALPGEWEAYSGDYRIVSAYIDTVPYIYATAGASSLLGDFIAGGLNRGNEDLVGIAGDLLKGGIAFEAMTNGTIDGVAR